MVKLQYIYTTERLGEKKIKTAHFIRYFDGEIMQIPYIGMPNSVIYNAHELLFHEKFKVG